MNSEKDLAIVKMLDVHGNQVYSENVGDRIDVSGLTPGVYNICITDVRGITAVKRIVVE